MTLISNWYFVRFDDRAITLDVNPPGRAAWRTEIAWASITRVCFQAGGWDEQDTIYLFTAERAESYQIPVAADGGLALWIEVLERRLFDAELAIEAAASDGGLFCCPSADQPGDM